MEQKNMRSGLLLGCLFFLCLFSLAFQKTFDYDAWIHLTFGKLIWLLKGFPATEPFIPSMAGKPFSYSSWLFGVLYYGAYSLFGPLGITLLKVASVIAIFAVLFRDSLAPCRRPAIALSILIVIAYFLRPRFIERPDTFLLIFLPFSIMALNVYLFENEKRYLYALPFVHLLWANCHSSINLMFVPFVAVFAGGVAENFLARKGVRIGQGITGAQARLIGIIFVASLVGSLISPYGITQFTFAYQFLQSDVLKQEILELRPTVWVNGSRWFFILLGFTALSFPAAWKRVSLADLARLLPLVVLAFQSRRFTYIFAAVAAPVLIRNLSHAVERIPQLSPRLLRLGGVVAACWLLGWTLAAHFDGSSQPRLRGYGFDLNDVPEGALAYLDSRHVAGRVYNPFHWGQYIEWRDTPRLVPFVDGRGYVAPALLEAIFTGSNMGEMARDYGLEAFVLEYPHPPESLKKVTDWDLCLSLPDWKLVYWDDLSLVYLRRGGPYDAVVQQDEYQVAKPANSIEAVETLARDPQKQALLVQELQRNVAQTHSSRGSIMLGHAFFAMGRYREGIEALLEVKDERYLQDAAICLGQCYEQLGDNARALQSFEAALKKGERSDAHYHLGLLLLQKGDAASAVTHLKRAVQMEKSLYAAYPALADAYRKLGKEGEANEVINSLTTLRQGEEAFNAGVKAYMEGRLPDAAAAFQQAAAANPTRALPYANLGFTQLDMGQPDKAFASFQQALKLDPNSSLAHFGAAMVYKMRGDAAAAASHWKRYLEIEPRGEYARVAKKELEGGR
ncbi:MAG TPA: tetratricopeptide repeat protein [Geomonas sp.]|nr:tetratricopeptide repeat protein [Geomonas sp.]